MDREVKPFQKIGGIKMNEENLVQEEPVTEVTENTDAQTVEDIEEGIELTDTASKEEEKEEVKTYTEEDFEKAVNDRINEILPRKIERESRKIEKKYRDEMSKYKETESILNAGLGTKDISEANTRMREYYKEQGIDVPVYQAPKYSDADEKALGEMEANNIISLGYEEMQEEANRLSDIGLDNMSPREKATFTKLASELSYQKQKKELAQIGVKEDMLNNSEFKEFASQFNSNTPIKNIYEMFEKIHQPKKQVEQIGSMKGNNKNVKDYYTPEEIDRLTDEELDNPAIWEKVRKSMTGQL